MALGELVIAADRICEQLITISIYVRYHHYHLHTQVTLADFMFAPGSAESEAGLHPWNSPGAAPTYGDGCGLNGGNPEGCEGEGEGGVCKYCDDSREIMLTPLSARPDLWAVLWRGRGGGQVELETNLCEDFKIAKKAPNTTSTFKNL